MKQAIQQDAQHIANSILFERFDKPDYSGWFVTGHAFGKYAAST